MTYLNQYLVADLNPMPKKNFVRLVRNIMMAKISCREVSDPSSMLEQGAVLVSGVIVIYAPGNF